MRLDQGVMNMTIKPLKQLAIMKDRISSKRVIKDCFKLLKYEQTWLLACNRLGYTKEQVLATQLALKLNKSTSQWFSQLANTDLEIISKTCLFLLNEIFSTDQIPPQIPLTSIDQINEIKQQFHKVNWMITIETFHIDRAELKKLLNVLIDDLRFNGLLSSVIDWLQQHDNPRFQQFARKIFLSFYLSNLKERNKDLPMIYEEQKLHIGFSTTKQHINHLYQQLCSSLKNNDNCYFKHFSHPLILNNYQIKQDKNMKRLRIEVPQQRLIEYAKLFQYGDFHNQVPKARGGLVHRSVFEIHSVYQAELNQKAYKYRYADNFSCLGQLAYFAQLSFVKTIALKYSCTMRQAIVRINQLKLPRLRIQRRKDK